MEGYKKISDIAKTLGLHKDTISYRIKELGITATEKYFYNKHQIELIKDFVRSPRTRYIIVESKMNKK